MTDDAVPHDTLNQALAAIMAEVSYIEKDATNSFHGYRYASEETIKKTLRAALVKHGVLFGLETFEPAVHTLRELKKNEQTVTTIVTLQCVASFTLVSTGETKDIRFVGSGSGRDDKGIYAAVTGAIKYALTSRFLIPTGDDPENDRNEPKAVAPQAPARPQNRPQSAAQGQARAQGQASPPAAPRGGTDGFKPTKPVHCPTCGGVSVFPSSKVPGGYYCAQSAKYQGCGAQWNAAEWVALKRAVQQAGSLVEPPPTDDDNLGF